MKKLICVLLCCTIVLGLAACGMSGDDEQTPAKNEPTETVTEETKAEDEIYRDGSAEAAAQKFIKSLLIADYKTAATCFDTPTETPYFTAEDVEWYLPRSIYADILDLTYTNYTVYVEKEYANNELAKCKVTISDKDSESTKEFTLNMHLNNSNKWGVEDCGFYFKEYYLVVPGGSTSVKVNDTKVSASSKYDTFGSEGLKEIYKLEYVGKSEKTFVVSAETFDTVTEKLYPTESNLENPHIISVYYTANTAYETIGKLWQGYYNAVMNDLQASELYHTISANADQKTADSLLTAMKTMIKKDVCTDYQLFNLKPCNSKDLKAEYLTSNEIIVYFNYSLSWVDNTNVEEPVNCTMNYYDTILLNLNNDKLTIHELLQNNNIFNYKNVETNEKR